MIIIQINQKLKKSIKILNNAYYNKRIILHHNNNLNLNIFQENLIKFDTKSLISSFQFGFVFFIAVAATNLFHQGNWQRVYAAKNKKILVKSLIISFFIFLF